jgi:enamine deaminase RidA (YjgF/YER057c/UK114 family)
MERKISKTTPCTVANGRRHKCFAKRFQPDGEEMSKLEHPRPKGLLHNAAFSQVVAASGTRTIYTAGQVSIDEAGSLVGAGDLAEQTAQVMRNVGLALAAVGADYGDIVKITPMSWTTGPNTGRS